MARVEAQRFCLFLKICCSYFNTGASTPKFGAAVCNFAHRKVVRFCRAKVPSLCVTGAVFTTQVFSQEQIAGKGLEYVLPWSDGIRHAQEKGVPGMKSAHDVW